jgi:hypothetical protein
MTRIRIDTDGVYRCGDAYQGAAGEVASVGVQGLGDTLAAVVAWGFHVPGAADLGRELHEITATVAALAYRLERTSVELKMRAIDAANAEQGANTGAFFDILGLLRGDRPHATISDRPGAATFSPNEVHQGEFGDCYELSALAALANSPAGLERLKEQIRYDPATKKWYVEFRGMNGPDGKIPWVVEVEDDETLQYADKTGAGGSAAWVRVMETAYEKTLGFSNFDNGGSPSDFFRDFLGTDSPYFPVYFDKDSSGVQPSDAEIWNALRAAQDQGTPMVASTFPDPSTMEKPPTPDQLAKDFEEFPGWEAEVKGTVPIVISHAYTILGVYQAPDGELRVQLRNPWGFKEPGNDGADDGVFSLSIAEFRRYYRFVFQAGL